jgi:glycosyltransferase involved in cell wall biosynthesis
MSKNSPAPQVSVVIPTYNRRAFVTMAIDSVLAQSYQDREIIVVDDGSTDDTPAVLKAYGDRIRTIRQRNSGPGAARNAGIQAARGRWIAFLDSDDEWSPEKLARQMADVTRQPGLCAHFTNVRFVLPDQDPVDLFKIRGFHPAGRAERVLSRPLLYVLDKETVVLSAFMARRDALLEAGPFDTTLFLAEDRDLLMRVALSGPWGFSSEDLVTYHRRPEDLLSLTRRFRGEGDYAKRASLRVLEKLRTESRLTPVERRRLDLHLSQGLFLLGLQQRGSGHWAQAANSFRRSLRVYPDTRTAIKYAVTLLPAKLGDLLLQRWQSATQTGFRA